MDNIDLLIDNISKGLGDFQKNIDSLKSHGEKAIIALLNAKATHIPGNRDGRDSVTDILTAISEISKDHKEFVLNLFSEELNKSNEQQKYISSLAWTLSAIDSKQVVPLLIKGLKHENKWIRWACCESLLRIKDVNSISGLITALGDRSSLVKSTAIEALSEFGTSEVIPHLEKLSRSKNKEISENARKAIESINRRIHSHKPT
jgi:HEAT repeat protein